MKRFTSLIAAATIASTILSPFSVFAMQNGNTESGKKMEKSTKQLKTLTDFICNDASSTSMVKNARTQAEVGWKSSKSTADYAERLAKSRADYAEKAAKQSAGSEERSAKLRGKSLMKRNLTDAQKAAFDAYTKTIETATKTRNDAIAAAVKTERTTNEHEIAIRKAAIDKALTARKDAITAAINTLKTHCGDTGDARIAAEKAFKDAISKARTDYYAAVKVAMTTYLNATKPVRDTRAAAIKTARQNFQTAAKAARETLLAALKVAKTNASTTSTAQ